MKSLPQLIKKQRPSLFEALRGLFSFKKIDADSIEQLEERLYQADFGVETTTEIMEAVRNAYKRDRALRGQNVAQIGSEILRRILSGAEATLSLDNTVTPTVICLVGSNGSGKTTTTAKLAHALQQDGYSVLMGACDTFRAAANEQLNIWSQRLAIPMVAGKKGADPAAVAYDSYQVAQSRKKAVLLLDTAGRLHTKTPLIDELCKIRRVLQKQDPTAPHHSWLVLDGHLGSNSIEQARVFHKAFQLTGLIVTKLDGTSRGGALVSIYRELKLPLYFVGLGEGMDALQPFNIDAYDKALFDDQGMEDTDSKPSSSSPSSIQVKVELGERRYSIFIETAIPSALHQTYQHLIHNKRKVVVITDASIYKKQVELFTLFEKAPLLRLPSGERTKSLKYLEQIYMFLAKHQLDRSSSLFAVGGGVIGDLAGFAAATYLRGIDFYSVATTLLAAVDSSVGGKTGINLPYGKNLVGAFHQPRAVFIATSLFTTLPPREFSDGMAEVIKYGLLGDHTFFKKIEQLERLQAQHPDLPAIIQTCCQLKAATVQADEKDQLLTGGRTLLNLGHTFAHAIERVAGYGTYLHGEAVAIGLCCAVMLSQQLGYLDTTAIERTTALLKRYDLPTRLKARLPVSKLLAAMRRDKKTHQGTLNLVVLYALGEATVTDQVQESTLSALWLSVGAKDA